MMYRRDMLKAAGLGTIWLGAGGLTYGLTNGQEPGLIVHTKDPHNAEPKLDQLVRSWITPNDQFYVRSHAPIPKIDVATFQLSVEGLVQRPFTVTLKQLRSQFRKSSVVATMTCAGNRRTEHSKVKKVGGVPWMEGAIGNAQWGGALLSDLLKKAGLKDNAKHVWFEGVDEIQRKNGIIPFGASIPIKKALGDSAEMPGALVAYEMNGVPLPPDHGFPMRTVVPGFIGARSVKWLGKIIVSDKPSTNHYVATAYKLVDESTPQKWAAAAPIENFVINSAICIPGKGAKPNAGAIEVSGYAIPPGLPGRTIKRVEVSTDGGKSWTNATFASEAKPYCWRLWKARVRISPNVESLTVRATDSSGAVQPKTVDWNLKGYLFNAWHQVRLG